jgi:hypothetical protein
MTARPTPPRRVRAAYVGQLAEWLSERDWAIVETVNALRLISGHQLERLCFASVKEGRSRTVTRSRVLARLVRARVLVPVGRRVGGSGRGSSVQAFALDSAGQRLLVERGFIAAERIRVRRPGAPGERFVRHTLMVSELYADLVETARSEPDVTVARFAAEPGCWWPDGQGGRLKPDAHVVLARPGVRDSWWIEIDRATESLPTIRAKLAAYRDFRRRGEQGPDGPMPWVLVSTISEARREAIAALVRQVPEAGELVRVVQSPEAARYMARVLRE